MQTNKANRLKKQVAARDGWNCKYCRKPLTLWSKTDGDWDTRLMNVATLDHVVSQADGGSDDLENLVIACFRCNASKHKRPSVEHNLRKYAARLLSGIRHESM